MRKLVKRLPRPEVERVVATRRPMYCLSRMDARSTHHHLHLSLRRQENQIHGRGFTKCHFLHHQHGTRKKNLGVS